MIGPATSSPTLASPFPQKTDEILFLDETGTGNYLGAAQMGAYAAATIAGKNPPFPVTFGLAGVLFKRADYEKFDRDFRAFKTKHLGTDAVPLHEYDLRKLKKQPYQPLRDPTRWASFRSDLHALFQGSTFKIIVATVHKPRMQSVYPTPFHPYRYSLHVILERVVNDHAYDAVTCRVVAEDRAAGLNAELATELLRLQYSGAGSDIPRSGNTISAETIRLTFDPQIVFRQKTLNDTGLQIADLAAGPITRHVYGFDATETRTLRDVLASKLRKSPRGVVHGWGLKCLPDYPPGCPL